MKYSTKYKIMKIVMLSFLFFLSMWIIHDTRLFIGLMIFATYLRYEDKVKASWEEWDGVDK